MLNPNIKDMKTIRIFKIIENIEYWDRAGCMMRIYYVLFLTIIMLMACAKETTNENKQARFPMNLAKKHFSWRENMLCNNLVKMLMVVSTPKVLETHDGYSDMDRWCIMRVTVHNKSAMHIMGSDYQVLFNGVDMRTEDSQTWSEKGKDLPPHGSVTFKYKVRYYYDLKKAYVNTTISNAEAFKKYVTSTGNEK